MRFVDSMIRCVINDLDLRESNTRKNFYSRAAAVHNFVDNGTIEVDMAILR